MNAFSVGNSDKSIIALSEGMLSVLSFKEIAGVLGHEISHIKNNDTNVLTFADISYRLTNVLSLLGQLLLLISLPLIIFTGLRIDFVPIVSLIAAPILSLLLQLALSRVREFNADIGSAMLLGEPEPLVSALLKMESYGTSFWESILYPKKRIEGSFLLKTHPSTNERVKRLLEISNKNNYTNKRCDVNYFPNINLINPFNIHGLI